MTSRSIAGAMCVLLLAVGCKTSGGARVVVGSKNFTEQIVLAEIVAQQIEAHASQRVERRVNLGGTLICQQAMRAGQIDLYVEYTGTALTAVLGEQPRGNAADVFAEVQKQYAGRFDFTVTEPVGFDNTFAIVVRGEDSRQSHLSKVSDLRAVAPRWRAGFGYEFMERPDGYRGWSETYGLRFAAAPRIMDLGLLYRALKDRQVDVVAGNSTDGLIAALDLTVLEDDRHYFPPYEAVPIVRSAVLEKYPAIREALRSLGGKISADEMRRMNYAVDDERREPRDVVREFRAKKGL